ncbi:FGGY-family carbohydrate kinase [Donghicola mangrovi]|uniref:FGGY family pentulose kinase n=1 Tax=Donghicola mangrovi TaxID=2729614 RepID=A0A850Q839_9RHOB|nr:FGGY family pentulose kinase [Donghicola mangrovi]NVO23158.1 FGGY family pentulose kinase [Donghicola mangrovi]
MTRYVCAVDVGTASARAALFDRSGTLLAKAVHPIALYQMEGARAEHASENIWEAVGICVRQVVTGVNATDVVAIGFDATCSLVLRDRTGAPLRLGPDGRDTILWFDHRAAPQAEVCNATGHPVLEVQGGSFSPEKQVPKLLWLKTRRPELWDQLGAAYDLADFLTFRASGSNARSANTITAKWSYVPSRGGWQHDFLEEIGLGDLVAQANLPADVTPLGQAVGTLTPDAAEHLGLTTGCKVTAGMVDAFAGALGAVGHCPGTDLADGTDLALIAGTSSCVMSVNRQAWSTRGVWGPYPDAILPGYSVSEGGQSATGALLDFILRNFGPDKTEAPEAHQRVEMRLRQMLDAEGPALADTIHILPDVNGNRSPFADPQMRGVISGLTMDQSFDSVCKLYWRAAVSLALGLRQIIEHMRAGGPAIRVLHVTGGHVRSELLMQLYADVTRCRVEIAADGDAVLLGTAALAAVTGGLHDDLISAATHMRQDGRVYLPNEQASRAYDGDYAIFVRMQQQRDELNAMRNATRN